MNVMNNDNGGTSLFLELKNPDNDVLLVSGNLKNPDNDGLDPRSYFLEATLVETNVSYRYFIYIAYRYVTVVIVDKLKDIIFFQVHIYLGTIPDIFLVKF